MTEYAKMCPRCELYYPGDCYNHGCKDEKCLCDGCLAHFNADAWEMDDDV